MGRKRRAEAPTMADNHGYDSSLQGQSNAHSTAAQPAVESAAAADSGAATGDASSKQFTTRRLRDRPLIKMSVDLIETYKQINKVRQSSRHHPPADSPARPPTRADRHPDRRRAMRPRRPCPARSSGSDLGLVAWGPVTWNLPAWTPAGPRSPGLKSALLWLERCKIP